VVVNIKKTVAALAVVILVTSCTSQRVALAPVGPNPESGVAPGHAGYLEVFSEREPVMEGDDPIFYQHTEYRIYDDRGKLVKDVGNTNGHFDTSPRLVSLPPGRYSVKARAEDYLTVLVPVVIERGRTTSVHLDDRWACPQSEPRNEFVFEPNGAPVGWKAEGVGGTGEQIPIYRAPEQRQRAVNQVQERFTPEPKP
jgi:hypothetical protein